VRQEHIERLLPASFQRTTTGHGVLDALLTVMQTLHAPSETVLSHVDDLVSAYRAPDVLLPFLVSWVAFDHLDVGAADGGVPAGRLRDLVDTAARLAASRGTAGGLCGLLSTVTGVDGYRVDEPADHPFHLVVRVPAAAAAHLELIHAVVTAEKPAATTFEAVLDQAATEAGTEAGTDKPLTGQE
jgi:phage tail-like protein